MTTVAVIGAGAWGTALAHLLSLKGHQVTIWAREPQVVESINQSHENKIFLKGQELDNKLKASLDFNETLGNAELIVNVIPTQYIRKTFEQLDISKLSSESVFVNASKGIEQKSLCLISEIFEEILPEFMKSRIAVLSGPSFAEEVVKGYPTSVTVASPDENLTKIVANWFHLPFFRTYTTQDMVGVQLGGALKNVMAIAAGAVDGMGLGLNTRAALITRGLSEIARLGIAMNADPQTFSGLSGMGDLLLTCTGNLSRNRSVGYRLGQGESIDSIIESMNSVAEGVATSRSAWNLAQKYSVDMPITKAVYGGLYESDSPKDALKQILSRNLKHDGI
jgi:glycerol-3-phosphate dehydrogenase (NAD(P)+)